MKVKLILLAFVLLVAGISKSEAQHYRYEKKYTKHYKKSYRYNRPAVVAYYPVVQRHRYYEGSSYPAYRHHYRYRHHRHMPPGQVKKYYRHKQHNRAHYY
ncbi:hypothetical protein [Niabella sp.]|uniref:hypothetical protein n=1 Tax=Niabella sp. TaxID=1962976 RepID=UPI002632ED81|nr:hypothetical protein [Niabella sp.]